MKSRAIGVMAALILSASVAQAVAVKAPPPLSWNLSMKKGIAAATKTDRPIILVFWATGSKAFEWFNLSIPQRAIRKANVVLVKLVPPTVMRPPAGASSTVIERYRKVNQRLQDQYRKFVTKYAVRRLPTVVFLSPDGETVFRSYMRKPQTTVLKGLPKLESWFADYKRLREALKEAEEEEKAKKAEKKIKIEKKKTDF